MTMLKPTTLKGIAFAVLLAAAVPAQAQMYKCIDAKGRASYSQHPGPGCKSTGGSTAKPPAGQQGPGAKGGPAPGSKGPAPGAKGADKGKGTAARQPAPAAAPPETKAQVSGRCEGARQQRAWLMGPKGEGVAHRHERIAQLDQALKDCPKVQ